MRRRGQERRGKESSQGNILGVRIRMCGVFFFPFSFVYVCVLLLGDVCFRGTKRDYVIVPFKMECCLYLLSKLKLGSGPGNLANQSKSV